MGYFSVVNQGSPRGHSVISATASLVERLPFPMLVLDSKLRITTANSAFFCASCSSGETVIDEYFPHFAACVWNVSALAVHLRPLTSEAGRAIELQAKSLSADDPSLPVVLPFRICAHSLEIDGNIAIIVAMDEAGFLRDRIQAATDALAQSRQDLRNLTARFVTAQEEERRRVARELHDDLIQRVALLAFEAEQLAGEAAVSFPPLATYLGRVRENTQRLSDDLRRVAHQLHPEILEHLGLSAALAEMAREYSLREDVLVSFLPLETRQPLSLDLSTTVYRIAQEALRNIVKHAGRTNVEISLFREPGVLRMVIQDFGKGFDASAVRDGLGLVSMRERANLLSGSVSVVSRLGMGTCITVVLPWTTTTK